MKKIKLIGNIANVLALILIVRRIIKYEIDWDIILSKDKIVILLLCTAAYVLLVILNHLPWMKLVEVFSGKRSTLKAFRGDFLEVYTKSNIFKYIPGNVFQYVGRNELAVRLGLNHLDIVSSTLLEIVMTVIAALLSAFALIGSFALTYVRKHWIALIIIVLAGLTIVTVLILLIRRKRGKWEDYLTRYRMVLNEKTALRDLLICFLYYAFSLFYSGAIYLVILRLCGESSTALNDVRIVLGAYILAWVAGYITPGSPGGIGIRELIMMTVIAGSQVASDTVITTSTVVFRIITIFGDVLAFVFVALWKCWRKNAAKKE